MHVLVTGGAGFIGSHLVDRLLAAGHKVRILDSLDEQVHQGIPAYLSREAELVVGDVRDRELVVRCLDGTDALVHLAAAVGVAQSMYEIERYTSVNALGAATVLQAAIDFRDRLQKAVVASSMSIYGEGLYRCPSEGVEIAPPPRSQAQLEARSWELTCPSCGSPLTPLPTRESKPLRPTSIYAIGKRDHEEMFIAWGRAYAVPVTALRFFNVYGTRQSLSNPYTGVAAIFASRLLNGRAPSIFEDGQQSRDFVHVSDITAGLEAALDPAAADGMALNLGSGQSITVLAVAEALAKSLGRAGEAEILVATFERVTSCHCFAAIEQARDELGFAPAVPFEQGMAELAGWLATQDATDRVDEATAALRARGLSG